MPELKYVGDGSWLPGVPARDLTDDEAKKYPEAAKSRLYEDRAPKKPSTRTGKE